MPFDSKGGILETAIPGELEKKDSGKTENMVGT